MCIEVISSELLAYGGETVLGMTKCVANVNGGTGDFSDEVDEIVGDVKVFYGNEI